MLNQRVINYQLLISILFLVSCSSVTPDLPQPVRIYATSAAQPYLADLYFCADRISLVLRLDAQTPEILLRIGEPADASLPMYQIGEEEIFVVVNAKSSVEKLNLIEVQHLFALGNPATQIWIFSEGEDIQTAFDQLAIKGRTAVSSARVAATAQQMSLAVGTESGAVGILPKTWLSESVRVVFSAGNTPVLAVTQQQPSRSVKQLVACLQKTK